MPNHPSHPVPPLDDDTAERLLTGRLHPDDAPPAYAEVARLLRSAAGPPLPDELAGQPAALAAFRAAGRARAGARRRWVALALAGTLAVGGVSAGAVAAGGVSAGGLWTTDGIPLLGWLGSPSGGPSNGGSGSGAAGSGAAGSGTAGAGAPGLLRPAGTTVPPAGDRATVREGGEVASRGRGPAHRARPGDPDKPKGSKPKASKPKGPKDPNAGPGQTEHRSRARAETADERRHQGRVEQQAPRH